MKKRILSAFLAVVMTACIMPFGSKNAYAADELPWSDLVLDAENWFNIFCDIAVESEERIHVKSDSAGSEEYTLLKKPDSSSALVEAQKKRVVQAAPLDVLVNHIDSCVELIHILRNAVNGIGFSSTLTALNDRFSQTVDSFVVLLSGFKSSVDNTISDLIQAYKYDTNPSYVNTNTNGVAMANNTFDKIRLRFDNLVSQSENLIGQYEAGEKAVNSALNKIMEYCDLNAEEKNNVLSEMDGILKKIDCLKDQKSALYDKIIEYSKKYTDFSYQLPGEEQLVIITAAISSIYGGTAALFGPPQDDAAIMFEGQQAIQQTYTDVLQEIFSLINKIASSSASTRDMDVVINAFIATHCCMRLVEVYLCDLSVFCENVSEFCQNMIDRFAAVVQAYSSGGSVNYIDAFKNEKYIEAYLLYMVNMTALKDLSIESLDILYKSRENFLAYEKETETYPDAHFDRAINSASALLAKMKEEESETLYSGTVIKKQPPNSLIIIVAGGAMILCGAGALICAKKKKESCNCERD